MFGGRAAGSGAARGRSRGGSLRGGDAGELVEAFVRTANGFGGSVERLRSCWARVEAMAAAALVPFAHDEAAALGRRMEAMGYPAVHHTDAFRAAYRPAYRVVARERGFRLPEA